MVRVIRQGKPVTLGFVSSSSMPVWTVCFKWTVGTQLLPPHLPLFGAAAATLHEQRVRHVGQLDAA